MQVVSYFSLSGLLVLFLKVKHNLFYDMLYIHIPFDTYKQKLKNKFKVSFFSCVESIVGNFIALPRTWPFSKSLQVISTFWKPLHDCHKSHDDWQEESNQFWFMSVCVRWLYREGDLAIFLIAGANIPCPQVFLEPHCCWWHCCLGWGSCSGSSRNTFWIFVQRVLPALRGS